MMYVMYLKKKGGGGVENKLIRSIKVLIEE